MKNLIMLVCMQIDTHWWQNNVFEKKKKISNLVPEFNHFLEWVVMILVIICLLSTHGTFSKIDHILYILYYICQASLDKYKNIEITCCILSDHNAKKLEFNNKRNIRKYTWRLKNTLIHDLWVIKKIREEIKKILEFNENESKTCQNLWDTTKAVLGVKFIAINACFKNTERSQISDLIWHHKILEKQEQPKPKSTRRIEKMKIRDKVNEIQTKITIPRKK
jgi:hypothetical protein